MGGAMSLPYGTGKVEIDAGGCAVELSIGAHPARPLSCNALTATLINPISSLGLRNLTAPDTSVVISVPDTTRVSGASTYIPVLVEHLGECGVPDDHMTILFALGLHRPLGEVEKMKQVTPEIFDRLECHNHNPTSKDDLARVGETSRGTPVDINRHAAEADVLITTGSVNFHFHAGYSGGPKGIVPGLAGEETIRRNHLLPLSGPDGWCFECRPGNTVGNPVFEDLLEAAQMAGPDIFLANSLVDPSGVMFDFVAGDLQKAHEIGRERFRKHFGLTVPGKADVAVVSPGGRPRDLNLIQAHKAIAHFTGAVREGGTIVLAAECPEGYGHPDLEHWFAFKSREALLEEAGRSKLKYPQTAFLLMEEARRFDIVLCTEMDESLVSAFGARKMTPAQAGEFIRAKHGSECCAYVSGSASTLVPFVEEESREARRPAP